MITLNNRMYLATMFHCSGIELAALALAAAGTGTQMYANDQVNRKAEGVAQAELSRQKKFQKEASANASKSIQESTPDVAKQQMDAGAQRAMQEYQKTQDIPLAVSSAPQQMNSSQSVVQQEAQKGQVSGNEAQNRAALQGYTSWDLQQWIKNLRAMQEQQRIANFSRGSAGVLPLELNAAAHSQDGTKAVGMGLSALGSLAGIYGAMAAPASAASSSSQVASIAPTSASGWDTGLYNYSNLGFNQQPLYTPGSWQFGNVSQPWGFH